MKFQVTHITRYAYSDPVSQCHNLTHLKPRNLPGQKCFASQVRIDPMPAVAREYRDFFGNLINYFGIQQAHDILTVTAVSDVEVNHLPLANENSASIPWEHVRDRIQQGGAGDYLEAALYTLDSPYTQVSGMLRSYAEPSFPPDRPLLSAVTELMERIYNDFQYDPNFSDIATPLDEVMAHKRGVCQDFAHLAIACVRAMGLPCRYVSGYLETVPPPGVAKLQGADASHAWFAVFLPGEGWLDFDPTNNQMPEEQHITTAVGRDFGDVTPVKGVLYGGGEHELSVSVDVMRLED
jgi:transglutaminase-like putative cysteine protease